MEYLGSGLLAEMQAEDEDERRESLAAEREAFRKLKAADEELDGHLAGLAKDAVAAGRRALEAAGCHQHARGQWRRRRGHRMAEAAEIVRIGEDEPMDVVDRASGGRFVASWELKLLIDRMTRKSSEAGKLAWQDVARVAEDLAGPDPTPTELLLARAAAADWLALQVYRSEYEGLLRPGGSGMSIQLSEHHQRRIDRTHRRMLRSIKTLAVVRRLATPSAPTIRVKAAVANIAQQQVNGAVAAARTALEGS